MKIVSVVKVTNGEHYIYLPLNDKFASESMETYVHRMLQSWALAKNIRIISVGICEEGY